MPRDYAKRVVEGARKLSPFLGRRMLPGHFLGTSAVLRELLPQDLKLEMDQLTREEAIGAARFLASVVGEAHAQQMDGDAAKRMVHGPETRSQQKARRAVMAVDECCSTRSQP